MLPCCEREEDGGIQAGAAFIEPGQPISDPALF